MKSRRIGAIVALVIAPALAYIAVHQKQAQQRRTIVARARMESEQWTVFAAKAAQTRSGFDVGQPFPRLPLADPNPSEVLPSPGSPMTVLMVYSLNVDTESKDLAEFRRLVDGHPNLKVVIVTEEPEPVVRKAAAVVRHARIRYTRAQPGLFDRIHQMGVLTAYSVDASGLIRRKQSFDNTVRLPQVATALQQQAGG